MATSEETLNQFLDHLKDDHITTRKMMGEYIIYYDKAVVGGLYDNRLLVKATNSSLSTLPNYELVEPYPNAKKMIHYPFTEDSDMILKVLSQIKKDLT
ncbi:TfoX/Sxy family protein [Staphylococcus pasteuri]|uniref:TfoX N-terminal domain-containing protein n=1 Tax=Staphylococcus pasteuri TaxID=45972 RepID=A0ABY1H3K1_9STAP|nr:MULTISPECIES: TfoX/Sxy family protein [Staphylococcus]RQX26940.1 transcriptional regulator [Staphylococcus warneri]ATH63055.1 transcriptional regulator [Staphylococcus pasteuri]KKI56922.1 hypothetical protein UF70_0565 [Staphylococcus pasteuri]MCD9065870.1 TfoX/Sxy family protein [Staphylococcus pasteuri]MCF7598687.1 TfoX/Sxy family protein [Staphylococcus pasteuri]